MKVLSVLLLAAALLMAAAFVANSPALIAQGVTPIPTVAGVPGAQVTFTWTPSPAPPTAIPTNTPRPSPTPVENGHFWFERPFIRDFSGNILDYPARGYAYGSTAGGGLNIHHGIDIENGFGTHIQAVADGTVFYAGPDDTVMFGPQFDFYGNLVVIQHTAASPDGRPLFSLYGHISSWMVSTGEVVKRGDTIAAVGSEGVAFGPHLHLEVRIGDPYSYGSTYNPELWVRPWEGFGVFAAHVVDAAGNPVYGVRVELIGQGRFFSGWTYANGPVNSDPYWKENVVIGDMPAGTYDLKVGEAREVLYKGQVTILDGKVSFIEIQLPVMNDTAG
ncbi:MAG: M23 family metallopeptidase [Anaerolineae bacterium]|nr:MAG: M23 family metallopeptidase [Anaerolineae bacterium]